MEKNMKDGFDYIPQTNQNKKDKYTTLSKLENGENKIRVLMTPVFFWQYWDPIMDQNGNPVLNDMGKPKGKPVRFPHDRQPSSEDAKYYMDLYIWDYKKKKTFILEISQKGVQNDLKSFQKD